MASLYGPPRIVSGAPEDATLPVAFETLPRQWSYVLTFDRSDASSGEYALPMVIRVTLELSAGAIGVGVLNAERTAFVNEVVIANTQTSVADVVVADPSSAGMLVVRNASAEGSSCGRVVNVECLAVAVDASGDREPGLSFPRPVAQWNRYYGHRNDTTVEQIRVQTFDTLRNPVDVRWSDGLTFRIHPNDQLSRALYVSSTYEPNTMSVIRALLAPGSVVFDVGANAGVFSVAASRWVTPGGHIYAFEPSPREYDRLLDNIQLNVLEAIVTPVRAAVSAAPGRAMLRVASAQYGGLNTLGSRFPYDGVDTAAMEEVEVTTLDAFVDRHPLGRVDVVKMDIEGAEAAALAGAVRTLRQFRPALVLELFSRSLAANGAGISDVEQHLRDADYRCFRIDDETAALLPVPDLTGLDEQNVVALPAESTNWEPFKDGQPRPVPQARSRA
jgi:FkbM family methyltransferase